MNETGNFNKRKSSALFLYLGKPQVSSRYILVCEFNPPFFLAKIKYVKRMIDALMMTFAKQSYGYIYSNPGVFETWNVSQLGEVSMKLK